MANVDFSLLKEDRDVLSIHADLMRLLGIAVPEYSSRNLTDPGIAQSLLVAGVADHLHLRHDLEAKQLQFENATRKSNVKNLLRLIGTDIAPPRAATVDVTLTLTDGAQAEDVKIPQYTSFEAPGAGVKFVNLGENDKIPAGSSSATITLTQGEYTVEVLGNSDGTQNQQFFTSATNILHNSAQQPTKFTVGGVAWAIKDSLAFSLPTDKHVMVRHEADATSRFVFGDGTNGAVPVYGDEISIITITGGGVSGNVGAATITSINDTILLNGASLAISVTNPLAASGGTDEQTVARAKVIGPAWWRSQDRAVTLADYEAVAKTYAGVLDARASRVGVATVKVAVLASSDAGSPSSGMLSGVLGYLEDRKCATDDVTTASPSLVRCDFSANVRAKRGETETVVKKRVEDVVKDFFDLTKRAAAGKPLFGKAATIDGHMYVSDIVALVDDTAGVENLDVTRLTRIPVIIKDTWTGGATFSDITVSNDTVDEEITVRFSNTTDFRVSGSASGPLGTGTLGTTFTDEKAKISFKISAGGASMAELDTARFRVSALVGNCKMYEAENEVAILGTVTITMVT